MGSNSKDDQDSGDRGTTQDVPEDTASTRMPPTTGSIMWMRNSINWMLQQPEVVVPVAEQVMATMILTKMAAANHKADDDSAAPNSSNTKDTHLELSTTAESDRAALGLSDPPGAYAEAPGTEPTRRRQSSIVILPAQQPSSEDSSDEESAIEAVSDKDDSVQSGKPEPVRVGHPERQRNRNVSLPEANLVIKQSLSSSTLPRALSLDDQSKTHRNNERKETVPLFRSTYSLWWCGLAMVLVAAAIALLVIVTIVYFLGKKSPTTIILTRTNAPTFSPTKAPMLVADYLLPLFPQETVQAITKVPDSPQSQAFQWLLEDVSEFRYSMLTNRIKQRFVLATLYYSTSGNSTWDNNTHWLSHSVHECDWFTKPEFARKTIVSKIYDGYLEGFLEPIMPMPCNSDGIYQHLWLDENNMVGSLPEELYLLTSLQTLSIGWNKQFGGTISTQIGQLTKIQGLFLGRMDLTGTIPSEIGLLSQLQFVSMGNNRLHGSIPEEIWMLTALDTLMLHRNQHLGGTISTGIGSLSRLIWLVLDECSLTGPLPTELGEAFSLSHFMVGGNLLSSTIPTELCLLSELKVLALYENSLEGILPAEIGLLTSTTFLSLSSNQLSGPLPSELGLLSNSMNALDLQNNQLLSGTIPTELGLLTNLVEFELSNNQLSGQVPAELVVLTSLGLLTLATNSLSGSLPPQLSALEHSLYTLKLEGNPLLSGTIPQELCSINGAWISNTWKSGGGPEGLSFDCTSLLCGCGCPC
ncbi:leucine Rich Repeat [Seminavis robusta]|uniref:Leucine Rich Repeat n=1 Tax=Seminavis robusta TaxID=568900 RepID=A0A9N8DG47_9STRA|nr:leucine Rich Repeat [Seminavis robusta]|eukprot:Sro52_g030870.1 leucine Rich Repeat (753) ;mRNA; r:25174-27514